VNTIFAIGNDTKGQYWRTINASGHYTNVEKGEGWFTRAHLSGGPDVYYLNNSKLYIWNVFIENYIKKLK
jgi:hypothetical protein